MSAAPPEVHHPLLKAAEVEAALFERSHNYNPMCKANHASISDMVGMSELGVTFVRLDPNTESTAAHYHLGDHEWVYILSGSGHLRLIDASLPVHTNQRGRPLRDPGNEHHTSNEEAIVNGIDPITSQHDGAGPNAGSLAAPSPLDIAQGPSKGLQFNQEFKPVGPGDFAGFMSGVKAAKYTHSLISGPEGMTYLMGGTRKVLDICAYPLVGKTIVFDDSEGDTIMTPVPRSGSPTPLPKRA